MTYMFMHACMHLCHLEAVLTLMEENWMKRGDSPPIAKIVVSRRKKDWKIFQKNFPHGTQSETAKTSKQRMLTRDKWTTSPLKGQLQGQN